MSNRPAATLVLGTLVLWAVFVPAAQATMPVLSPAPHPPSLAACQRWAARQGEDARYMWGMQKAGGLSDTVAVARLTASCLGRKPPDIVGFGSSVGFDNAYCETHEAAGVCRNR